MSTPLSPHFTLEEFVRPKVDRTKCALPFSECRDNLQALCIMLLEPWRAEVGAMACNSGLRDMVFNASIALDPASAARVAQRPGPHTTGESGDMRILAIDKLPEPDRSNGYIKAFAILHRLAQAGLPVHEAILEYAKGDLLNPTSSRITHIHVQYQCRKPPSRRFVARRWKLVGGQLAENYLPWRP